jgi:predicted nucleic acid-binding Zn ribbon protein
VDVKTLLCPHCHTQVPEQANVCTGCGAEIVRGLSRRGRSFVELAFVAASIFLFGFSLNAYQVINGHPFLKQSKAEDDLYPILGIIIVVVIPYLLGTRITRLFRKSRVRFFRSYQHQ